MTVNEAAKELGIAIKDSEVLKNYEKAKEDYEGNAELSEKLSQYNAQRAALSDEFNKDIEVQDSALIQSIKDSMDVLGKDIISREEYKAFEVAKKAMDDLMSQVNAQISYFAFGIEPTNCTHDCSTCSGCH